MFHLIASGDVQGVGFRQFVRYNARKLSIKGWVKNLDNGNVEVVLVGEPEKLEKMIKITRNGPAISLVRDVKIEELPDEEFEGFEILK